MDESRDSAAAGDVEHPRDSDSPALAATRQAAGVVPLMERRNGMAQANEQKAPKSAAELPEVINLGDAATLTKGNTSSSVESKQTPYS